MKRIFLTGGFGVLGSKLLNYLSENNIVYAPNKAECDILDLDILKNKIVSFNPDIVIHLAAFVDTFGCENNINKAIDTNIIGTINVVKSCVDLDCKVVYVSSEYVFSGNRGLYKVDDRLDPINVYGKTKASSEYIISILKNYQIIRAPFIKKIYSNAFTDQFCSRYFIDEILEKITNNIINNNSKIVHISDERNSLYEIYKKHGIDVLPVSMNEQQLLILPKDTSLINNSI